MCEESQGFLRDLWRGWAWGRQTLLLKADELLGQFDPLTLGVQDLWTSKTSKDLPKKCPFHKHIPDWGLMGSEPPDEEEFLLCLIPIALCSHSLSWTLALLLCCHPSSDVLSLKPSGAGGGHPLLQHFLSLPFRSEPESARICQNLHESA